ncbi:MAG: hypothetical protein ACTS73_05540 [Arsenophonus sp. NEOnobi-MAG3]
MRWGYSLRLQGYHCKIPNCRKTFNNYTGSPLARGYHKDK